jgi:hypothetical protein
MDCSTNPAFHPAPEITSPRKQTANPAAHKETYRTIRGRCYHGMDYRGKMVRVKVDKLSVSFEADLGDAVRSAAAQAGKPVSSWLAEAAASKLRAEALAEFLAAWEAERGMLTAGEVARAERELGLAAGDSAA